tara:strand:- start:1118 stop:1528 length:411 start_codon:yes stop_codon:yes gene_type:complete
MTGLNVIQEGGREAQSEKVNVLIMEKYDFSSMVLSTILSDEDYSPKVIRDPKLLPEELDDSLPPVLFYDLDLQSDSDEKVLKKIKEKFPKLKIIIINYIGQEINKEELKKDYGIIDVVQRPFSRRQVLSALKNAGV